MWSIPGSGTRRTPSLRGGLLARAPFFWDASRPDFAAAIQQHFVRAQTNQQFQERQVEALGRWLNGQRTLRRAPRDAPAAERGRQLFESQSVGCARCHAGPQYTRSTLEGVGKGLPMRVPSLQGVGLRAPLMHDGCAASLRACFEPACGGSEHGRTAQLSAAQLDDLIAYRLNPLTP